MHSEIEGTGFEASAKGIERVLLEEEVGWEESKI
jgi:hypothetical protein